MSRFQQFVNDIEQALSASRKGTKGSQVRKRYILMSMAKDLRAMHSLPPNLKKLKSDNVHKLVALWRSKGNQDITLLRKIGAIRQVLTSYGLEGICPSNQSLGIEYKNPKPRTVIGAIQSPKMDDFEGNSTLLLQYYFGLTANEAIKYEYFLIQSDHLIVPRAVAYNHKERRIPIARQEQAVIAQHEKQSGNIKTRKCRHNIAFDAQGGLIKEIFRYGYAQWRWPKIQTQYAHSTNNMRLRTLREELGYQRNPPLIEILTWLENSY